jgi:hypothetical protein
MPRPGAIGFGVDLGLSVSGFVDVGLLPYDGSDWPKVGMVLELEVWDFVRPQIRLKPIDARYLRPNFDTWVRHRRPDWITGRH